MSPFLLKSASYDPVNDALDFGAALTGVAEKLAPRIDTLCLERTPLDVDDELPGLQASCEIVQIQPGDGETPIETVIAACDAAPEVSPCFRLQDNADQCSASGLELLVDRGDIPAPAGSTISLRCALGDGA